MKQRALNRFSEKMGIPDEIFEKIPLITIHGTSKLTMEGRGAILEYTDSRISVDTTQSIVRIKGTALSITCLTRCFLEVQGQILTVEVGEEL